MGTLQHIYCNIYYSVFWISTPYRKKIVKGSIVWNYIGRIFLKLSIAEPEPLEHNYHHINNTFSVYIIVSMYFIIFITSLHCFEGTLFLKLLCFFNTLLSNYVVCLADLTLVECFELFTFDLFQVVILPH